MPAISTRFARIAAVAFAFSGASGHENATRVSPAQPAWYASSALYVAVAGLPRTPLTRTRSEPRSSNCRAREVRDDVGREVRRRVVHLVEELVAHGVEVDSARPTPAAW